MAATVTAGTTIPLGPKMKIAVVDIAMPASYTAAGETADLSDIFDTEVYGGWPIEHDADLLYKLTYDRAASGAPATGKVVASYYDYDAGADGDAIDVAAEVDLSSLDGNWVFIGY